MYKAKHRSNLLIGKRKGKNYEKRKICVIDIFKELDSRFNINQQLRNIIDLFNRTSVSVQGSGYHSIKTIFDNRIVLNWKHSNGLISFNQFIENLGLKEDSILDEIGILKYISLMLNVTKACEITNAYCVNLDETKASILERIAYCVDKLGYEVVYDKKTDYFFIKRKRASVKSVVEKINDKNVLLKIYEYDYVENVNNIEKKKSILRSLANDIESILKDNRIAVKVDKIWNIKRPDFHKITYICSKALNELNIRHNNIELNNQHYKQYTFDLSNTPKKLLKLYDKTFDLILQVYMIKDFLDNETMWSEVGKELGWKQL